MFKLFRRNEEGAAAIEFAIAVPVLVLMLYGIFQIGLLFQANAGMQHALGEGARLATLYDTSTSNKVPTDTAIKAKMNATLFGKSDGNFTVADPVTVGNYKTLTVSYSRPMSFLFFQGPTVTISRSKRVYTVINS